MSRSIGWTFVVFPLAVQVPFALLGHRFDYPAVLRHPAWEVLRAFAAGGPPLLWTWYAYALVLAPFLVAIAALPAVLQGHSSRRLLGAVTPLGVASAVVQMAGLLRWTLVVPVLTRAEAAGVPAETVALVYQVQHQLFGVLLGEHLGQLLLALWTAGVSWGLRGAGRLAGLRTGLGLAAAGLFLLGLADGLGTVGALSPGPLAHAPLLAFAAWSLWCVATGVTLLPRRGQAGTALSPSPV